MSRCVQELPERAFDCDCGVRFQRRHQTSVIVVARRRQRPIGTLTSDKLRYGQFFKISI